MRQLLVKNRKYLVHSN